MPEPTPPVATVRRGLRRFTRRHAVISGLIMAVGVLALIVVGEGRDAGRQPL